MTDDALIPCIIYAARSAKDEQERSTGSQTDEVRARIDALGGREVLAEFAESGVSGYLGERGPELDAAMDAAKAGAAERGVDAELWVFHSSRLARGSGRRGRRSLVKIHADLLYEDVQVRSVGDDEFMQNPMLVGVASEQNFKYARDHGEHVARGKRAAIERGDWPGGPVPDGYLADRSFDDRSRKVVTVIIDPERAPVIRAVFDLAEQGAGDPTVARHLNEAGHRTKAGRPWTRRRVQSALLNQAYAGRVVRYGEGSHKGGSYRRFDAPEVRPGLHPALIEPERYDRIRAMRPERDKSKSGREKATPTERGRRGGRPTTRYALAKLGTCDRCGERMYATTSPYKRKDGSQAKRYICANVRTGTGLCDQPRVPAERVDAAVVDYLDRLFIDVEAWSEEIAAGADGQREATESALAVERERLAKHERRESGLRERYLAAVEEDDERRERLLFNYLADLEADCEESRQRITAMHEKAEALADEEPPMDAMLDLYNDLRRTISGGDGSLSDLNERLRQEFEEFRFDTLEDGTVGILPVLRERRFSGAEIAALYSEWHEAGEPAPTDEEVAAYEARDGRDDPIWTSVRPPARALAVVDPKQSDPQL